MRLQTPDFETNQKCIYFLIQSCLIFIYYWRAMFKIDQFISQVQRYQSQKYSTNWELDLHSSASVITQSSFVIRSDQLTNLDWLPQPSLAVLWSS